jgi:serine/threonine protein kinase
MGEGGFLGQVLETGVGFAGYRIEALLGRGGMSEVYRASNPRLGNTVAVKLLARELAEDEVFQERFTRESRLAASLNHPNVVPIFDAGESEGLPYIAMRYVDGPDLKQLIAREGPLPLDYTASILGQVAAALDTAHEKGLIHRDVKPGNILIDEKAGTEGAPHVYLSDFGVAKHSQSRSGLTSTGHFVGTIDYIAPEQIEGKPLDGTTDLYSLGCLLYECLTGVPPFDRDTDVAMIYAHLVDPAPPVTEKRPDLPPSLDGVIAKALSKRPEDRYRTCREFVSAVRATYGADTAGFPIAKPTAVTPVVSETVLTPSTSGVDAPPTTLSDEPPAPVPAPPTALAGADAPGSATPIPPTEIAGAAGAAPPPPPPGVAPGGGDAPTGLIEERPTRQGPAGSRPRVWSRPLVVGVAALLLAGGAAAAVLTTSSGKKTTTTQQKTGGGTSTGGTDVTGGAVNPTVSQTRHTGTATHTTTRQKTTTATTRRTTTRATTTGRRRTTTSSTSSTTTDRRRTTTSSAGGATTTTDRRRGGTSTTTSSSPRRR